MIFTNWMENGKENCKHFKKKTFGTIYKIHRDCEMFRDMLNYLFEEIEKQASERGKKMFSYNFKWKFSKKIRKRI